jgi:hypothetical protein
MSFKLGKKARNHLVATLTDPMVGGRVDLCDPQGVILGTAVIPDGYFGPIVGGETKAQVELLIVITVTGRYIPHKLRFYASDGTHVMDVWDEDVLGLLSRQMDIAELPAGWGIGMGMPSDPKPMIP